MLLSRWWLVVFYSCLELTSSKIRVEVVSPSAVLEDFEFEYDGTEDFDGLEPKLYATYKSTFGGTDNIEGVYRNLRIGNDLTHPRTVGSSHRAVISTGSPLTLDIIRAGSFGINFFQVAVSSVDPGFRIEFKHGRGEVIRWKGSDLISISDDTVKQTLKGPVALRFYFSGKSINRIRMLMVKAGEGALEIVTDRQTCAYEKSFCARRNFAYTGETIAREIEARIPHCVELCQKKQAAIWTWNVHNDVCTCALKGVRVSDPNSVSGRIPCRITDWGDSSVAPVRVTTNVGHTNVEMLPATSMLDDADFSYKGTASFNELAVGPHSEREVVFVADAVKGVYRGLQLVNGGSAIHAVVQSDNPLSLNLTQTGVHGVNFFEMEVLKINAGIVMRFLLVDEVVFSWNSRDAFVAARHDSYLKRVIALPVKIQFSFYSKIFNRIRFSQDSPGKAGLLVHLTTHNHTLGYQKSHCIEDNVAYTGDAAFESPLANFSLCSRFCATKGVTLWTWNKETKVCTVRAVGGQQVQRGSVSGKIPCSATSWVSAVPSQ